ncbi:hypothetical protein OIE63_38550 [Streptomyces sp. NBC_01795]|uniref:hypothetical protein n=1 Tax=unclassified Streptomyces TaxID=2593676 RepID=UPI002DDC1C98|nr:MULTISPECIES: hypothetical protein [unclassified Streptomyces]WSA96800.1 hypothetical protein OIE63_38550 [Streptomyces sp. NBC_01795]WSS10577.1 hypothetical protein OG533_00605 [Streptomyces sp. NBC_01186]
MSFSGTAGLGGLGFVVIAVVLNVLYTRGRLPLPTSGQSVDEVADVMSGMGRSLKRPSVLAPASWLFLTLFAAGLLSELWQRDGGARAWALTGFAGVLVQNAVFTVVEALRFGTASAAAHNRGSVPGLWATTRVLFGFNQVFLAAALIGFTAAGTAAGLMQPWHAGVGYVSAALLFLSASASPYGADGTHRLAPAGLIGWLGWATWLVTWSVVLLGL